MAHTPREAASGAHYLVHFSNNFFAKWRP